MNTPTYTKGDTIRVPTIEENRALTHMDGDYWTGKLWASNPLHFGGMVGTVSDVSVSRDLEVAAYTVRFADPNAITNVTEYL